MGVVRSTLINQPLSQLIFKEDLDSYHFYKKHFAETSAPQHYELRMVKNDGTGFWVHFVTTTAQDNGELICRLVLKDITERKHVEEALRESEEKFRLLYTSMDQGLGLHEIITDSSGKPVDFVFLDINDNYTRILGITREQAIGKRITEIIPNIEQYLIDIFGKVALTGKPSYDENHLLPSGGFYSTYTYSPKKN